MQQIETLQKNVLSKYKKFKIKKENISFKKLCWPEKYTHQKPQLFVSQYISPATNNKGLLLYHKIGAGKTCAAVLIAEAWKHKRKVIMLCPASLVGNFYKEIRSECTYSAYLTKEERKELEQMDPTGNEYRAKIKEINAKIDEHYKILSYNKFATLATNKKINLKNTLLIIDEVQNIVSEHGNYYKIIMGLIKKSDDDLRIVIMSATPIFDKPMELGLTLNLLKPKTEFPIGSKFDEQFIDYKVVDSKPEYNIKNTKLLANMLNGLVSYYQGADPKTFPETIRKIVKCPMSKYQYDCYTIVQNREGTINKMELLKLPSNFFIGSRIISNIAFSNKLVGKLGYDALTRNMMQLNNLKTYSCKFYKMLKKVLKSKGSIFIYSNFREYGGLLTFIKILEANGFTNFLTHGDGKNRYAVWSGDESMNDREMIRNVFNSYSNREGAKIKIILGSPAIKEGVSLFRCRYVLIMEPYWNSSRIAQVEGRAVRFCSHKDVDPEKRYVKIYLYLSVVPEYISQKEKITYPNKNDRTITVDEYIYNMSQTKLKLSNQFEQIIKNTAVDRLLFQ